MNKTKIVVAIAIIAGVLLILQIRSFKKVELLVQRSGPKNFLSELRILQAANQQLKEHVGEAEKELSDMNNKIASQTIEDEINNLNLVSGKIPVFGEGIEMTFSESVAAFWISDLIAQLVSGGAEAIAINDIRLTHQTAGLREVFGSKNDEITGLLVRRFFIKTPINVAVIGPKHDLKNAIARDGGIIDRIRNKYPGITVMIVEKDKIAISALPQ